MIISAIGAKRKRDTASQEDLLSGKIVTAKPANEARGHTGYLTFARRIVRETEELEAVQPDIEPNEVQK